MMPLPGPAILMAQINFRDGTAVCFRQMDCKYVAGTDSVGVWLIVLREDALSLLAARGHSNYCLSYTAVFVTFLPCALVAVVVTVRVLPSCETTIRPLSVTLPPFFPVSVNVC